MLRSQKKRRYIDILGFYRYFTVQEASEHLRSTYKQINVSNIR